MDELGTIRWPSQYQCGMGCKGVWDEGCNGMQGGFLQATNEGDQGSNPMAERTSLQVKGQGLPRSSEQVKDEVGEGPIQTADRPVYNPTGVPVIIKLTMGSIESRGVHKYDIVTGKAKGEETGDV